MLCSTCCQDDYDRMRCEVEGLHRISLSGVSVAYALRLSVSAAAPCDSTLCSPQQRLCRTTCCLRPQLWPTGHVAAS